ncbi:MAG: putative molybdenum carrier protein [Alphaproteobacteria bacterium]
MIRKIVSGGQTGVDRAALDAAAQAGLDRGGWCPRDRRAEDGPIDPVYLLHETPARGYAQRTTWNVRDSDGTLILTRGPPIGGTALTVRVAAQLHKPFLVVDLADDGNVEGVRAWIEGHGLETVNVAGPRESERPGIYAQACAFLSRLFAAG